MAGIQQETATISVAPFLILHLRPSSPVTSPSVLHRPTLLPQDRIDLYCGISDQKSGTVRARLPCPHSTEQFYSMASTAEEHVCNSTNSEFLPSLTNIPQDSLLILDTNTERIDSHQDGSEMLQQVPQAKDVRPLALLTSIEERIPRIMSARTSEGDFDPIMADLVKLNSNSRLELPQDDLDDFLVPDLAETMEEYSLRLLELLDLLLEQHIDEHLRIQFELQLKDHTMAVPLYEEKNAYPKDYLSRIIIDNYLHLLKLATLYFNMSLLSHITRFCVRLFYSIECWEIYHLLLIVPNLEYFLKLVDISVTTTPFGHVVKPPENFMRFNLRQGYQYPFPYPFYNFSYHTVDPETTARKFARVNFEPYIDIRLKKTSGKRPKRPRSWPRLPDAELANTKIEDATSQLLRAKGAGASPELLGDFQKHQKVFIFMNITPDRIMEDHNTLNSEDNDDDDDNDYNTDEAIALTALETESARIRNVEGVKIIPSTFEKVLQDAEKKGLARLTQLHQCRLEDPATKRPCLKIFYGKNELQRHQEFVHATKKKIYRCAYCEDEGNSDQCYPRHDSLARHIRRKHGITGKENKIAVQLAKQKADYMDDSESAGPSGPYNYGPMPQYVRNPASFETKQLQFGSPYNAPQATIDSESKNKDVGFPRPPSFLTGVPLRSSLPGPTDKNIAVSSPGKSDKPDQPAAQYAYPNQYSYPQSMDSKSSKVAAAAPGTLVSTSPSLIHPGYQASYAVPTYSKYGSGPWLPPPSALIGAQKDSHSAEESRKRPAESAAMLDHGHMPYQFSNAYYPIGTFQPHYGQIYTPPEVYLGRAHMPMQVPTKLGLHYPLVHVVPAASLQHNDQRSPEQRPSMPHGAPHQHQTPIQQQQSSLYPLQLPSKLPRRPEK